MNDLLAFAVQAHGGLDRWNTFKALRAELSVDGAIWQVKQQPGLLTDKVFEIKTHEERLTITLFAAPDRRSIFVPGRLVLETLDGNAVEQRDNPQASFAGQERETPWDKFQVAYFASEAAIKAGLADAVAFGRMFIANPDLPERIRTGAALNAFDRSTAYGGDARGYTDYSTLGILARVA